MTASDQAKNVLDGVTALLAEIEAMRAGVDRLRHEIKALRAGVDRLRHEIEEATDPNFIWGALDNVHDAETTLDDYADAVSRAQRTALARVKGG